MKRKSSKTDMLRGAFALGQAIAQRAYYSSIDHPAKDKPAPITRTDRTFTEQYFRAEKRILAYQQGDDLYFNDPIGSTVDLCVRLAIGQKGGNPTFTGDRKEIAQARFDSWRRHCGFSEGESLQECLSVILRTCKVHGDCLVLCDEHLTGGKLRMFDADQIVNISEADFGRWCRDNSGWDGDAMTPETQWRQVEGVVTDTAGAVKGYFATTLRNRYAVSLSQAVFLPASICRRVGSRRIMSAYRSGPVILQNQQLTTDTRDLIKSEVQAAKNASEMALVYKPPQSVANADIASLLSGMTEAQLLDGTGATVEQLREAVGGDGAKTFQAFAGRSAIAEIPAGSDIQSLDNANRPSSQIQSFMTSLADENGKRLGVMSCLSRGRADNSYSSGQIELSIAWTQFQEDQKMLERQVIDYLCDVVCPGETYVVSWPQAFEIDPQKAEATIDARLRGGRTTYREVLGPDWKTKLDELADEVAYARSKGLDFLSISQTVSGAQVVADVGNEENSK